MAGFDKVEIGKRLTEIIARTGLNTRQFAIAIEGDASYLGKVEKGIKSLSGSYVQKIVSKYHVNKNWLLVGEGSMYKKGTNVPHETDLAEALQKLQNWQAGIDATLKVIIDELGPVLSKASGRSNASVLSDLRKDIEQETANRLKQLKRE